MSQSEFKFFSANVDNKNMYIYRILAGQEKNGDRTRIKSCLEKVPSR